jgi:hypothetical protein
MYWRAPAGLGGRLARPVDGLRAFPFRLPGGASLRLGLPNRRISPRQHRFRSSSSRPTPRIQTTCFVVHG